MRTSLVSALCLSVLWIVLGCHKEDKIHFSIESGNAVKTLKVFAIQAGVEILIDENELEGIQTRPIEGTMTKIDALELMIFETGIVYNQDQETDAIAVSLPQKE